MATPVRSLKFVSFQISLIFHVGWYTLSVNCKSIGHWRISTKKIGNQNAKFYIDGVEYSSFFDIIERHTKNREPLPSKGSDEFYLGESVDKYHNDSKIQMIFAKNFFS